MFSILSSCEISNFVCDFLEALEKCLKMISTISLNPKKVVSITSSKYESRTALQRQWFWKRWYFKDFSFSGLYYNYFLSDLLIICIGSCAKKTWCGKSFWISIWVSFYTFCIFEENNFFCKPTSKLERAICTIT